MPINFSVNLAYQDIYGDPAAVNPAALIATIPTKMALALVCHFTAQMHDLDRNPHGQVLLVEQWSQRFPAAVRLRIGQRVQEFANHGLSNFSFFNNISSLYCIEFILGHPNALPLVADLTPQQEEDLFKLYLYFSSDWTKHQLTFMQANADRPTLEWILALMAPFEEIVSHKDFRIQFIKAIYFFKFCETDPEFAPYLALFLQLRQLSSWKQYLVQLCTLYLQAAGADIFRTVIHFQPSDQSIYQSLSSLFVALPLASNIDFLGLRRSPLYAYSANEVLILHPNFLVDKLFQAILFDMGAAVIQGGGTYHGQPILTIPTFIGIFSDDFVETIMFYRVMQNTFKRNPHQHFTGDQLTAQFGDGTPDYILIDRHKVYVVEFKNALFSAAAKYSYDPAVINQEIRQKFIENANGSPKGVTQLANFFGDVLENRYAVILPPGQPFTFYPIIATTDGNFNLPTINRNLDAEFSNQVMNGHYRDSLNIQPLTLVHLDDLIKFQDLFKTMQLSLHRELTRYHKSLLEATVDIDKALSFHNFLHGITRKMKYGTPEIFFTEIGALFPAQ
jgi:hypothetical protein